MARRQKALAASGIDSFSNIPDAVVQHVLSFLPAQDAVRTCVLARRWCHLWRSLPRLRISNSNGINFWSLNKFIHRVLLLREPGLALNECEFDIRLSQEDSGLYSTYLDLWIRQALACRLQILRVRVFADERINVADWPLVSMHLTTLELDGLELEDGFIDLSSCPVLEDLKITNCQTEADNILSRSLKHLKIASCNICYRLDPTHISSPSLISLHLYDYTAVTPVLEPMPLLETASIKLGQNDEDNCDFYDEGGSEECSCNMCLNYFSQGGRNDICVLLRGLSSATSLELIASLEMITFKRDLRFCPMFSKLKALFLKDWCLVADQHALLCFLQNTPVLEKLVLQVRMIPKPAAEIEGCNLTQQSLTLRKLKSVVVKCPRYDERVQNILEKLCSCSTGPQVIVQEM